MRLIIVARMVGRQLCRAGLHKWGRVREITSLDLKGTSIAATGEQMLREAGLPRVEAAFWATGERYAIRCGRPGCKAERAAK